MSIKRLINITKIVSAAFLLLTLMSFDRNRLLMNYKAADISTSDGEAVVLAGFAARKGLSTGVHQHLLTHCLVISDGSQKVCIISNDLMEISPALSDSIRTLIADASGLPKERILMHNIHTHSAPRLGGSSVLTGGTNRAYKSRTVSAIVANAADVIKNDKAFRKFDLEIAKAKTSINANRCEKGGPADHDVYAARFLVKGKPAVSVINLACHPVCMGPKSHLLSSDYSGVAIGSLIESWGGAMFQLTGAAGNMDPARGPKEKDYAEECGKSLADSLSGVKFRKVRNTGRLSVVNDSVDLPYLVDTVTREDVIRHADSLVNTTSQVSATFKDDVRGWEKEILSRFDKGPVPSKLRYHLHTVDIDGVIFLFSDGEPFCEYQMDLRKAFPDRTIFFAGYTNGQNSYLPSERAYQRRKGYEYEVEQMHIYVKAPYPLSPNMPETYSAGLKSIIATTIDSEQ
ncbi:MAG: neutral/alkaline non-lysosomal ceramidase N-terminal domain-containing protein [Bacteroidales bacterium]